jgi:nitrate/nitrite-specific signal transduction histidine kinase
MSSPLGSRRRLLKVPSRFEPRISKAKIIAKYLRRQSLMSPFMLALALVILMGLRLSGISCSFICVGQVEIRDNARAVHLFRIAQEALNNAIQHGRPKTVVVALEASNGALSLRVSDDGVGFDPGSERKGMGLNIMRYRARMLAGTLEIQSNSPVGTMVTCTIARPPTSARGSNSTGLG